MHQIRVDLGTSTCGQYLRVDSTYVWTVDSVQYVRTPRYDSMLVLIRVVQYVMHNA